MLERYYDPTSGEIRIDGVPLTEFSLSQLRSSIGYVSQEPSLILGTIKDNLVFSCKDATAEDIQMALDKANAKFV